MTVIARPSAQDVVIELTQSTTRIILDTQAARQLVEAIDNSLLYNQRPLSDAAH